MTTEQDPLGELMALADSYAMTTEVKAAAKARRALVDRLNMKAGVMEMGEKIAWGSDTALMREAAGKIAEMEAQLDAVGAGGVSALMGEDPAGQEAPQDAWLRGHIAGLEKARDVCRIVGDQETNFEAADCADAIHEQQSMVTRADYTPPRAAAKKEPS